ncbi:uncharacterized protein LOC116305155 [Actinia tenebrosa]|uniref:Uncharacterized protein LOC116305155 n=1 Tax=Actinia tenebrosa TaxID=6105 RepID=A0A6P8IY21_ACTTE|nr:uncharacterized protein LOC116305155 [Actinia tenebrosa]
MSKAKLTLFILARVFFASFFVFLVWCNYEKVTFRKDFSTDEFDELIKNWCRVRRERQDVESKLKPCNFNISWEARNNDERRKTLSTDPDKSIISEFNIQPAGEFSSFKIQTKTSEGRNKSIGGDSWRVVLRGKASFAPTVFDLGNGQYEVLFLAADPGVYKVEIVLDYSLCDGYRDPPSDWFRKGNSQGKMQPVGSLEGHAHKDYLLKAFQKGRDVYINVPLPQKEGFFLVHSHNIEDLSKYDPMCKSSCSYVWDGYGRWMDDEWVPHLKAKSTINTSIPIGRKRQYSTLLLYGDSQADRLHASLIKSPICKKMFKSCKVRKLWAYPYDGEIPPWDEKDFEPNQIIQDIKEALENPDMDENSLFIFNLGLHYSMGISFVGYQELMKGVVKQIQEVRSKGFKGKVIWKTTTSLSKEKDTDELLFSDRKRFLNLPRVDLFNAYANKLMCDSGIEVLDVYPLTRSFPDGTGGPEVAYYKEHDIVHFKVYVLRPLELLLEKYLLGQVPYPISWSNYFFS